MFEQGLLVTLIGFTTVFIVLAIMWAFLEIMNRVLARFAEADEGARGKTNDSHGANDEFIDVLKAAISSSTGKDVNSFSIMSYTKIK